MKLFVHQVVNSGAQPKAAKIANVCSVTAEVNKNVIEKDTIKDGLMKLFLI